MVCCAGRPSRDFRWTALFFLALVAGFLSKGFIGLVFPGLIGLLYAWHLRERRLLNLLFSPGGIILAAILLVAWGWATESANPGWLKFQVVNEQIMRFLGRREPPDVNSFTLAGFYVFLCIWLMPWTFILPSALYRFWPATRPGREVGAAGRLLLIWAAVILGFFTLSSSRIEYYSLPALPALALILGWRIQRYLDTPGDRIIPWTLLALGLLGLSLLVLLPYLEQVCVDNRREFSAWSASSLPWPGRPAGSFRRWPWRGSWPPGSGVPAWRWPPMASWPWP